MRSKSNKKELVKGMLDAGHEIGWIAFSLGISEQMVKLYMKDYNKIKTEELVDRIFELSEQGMSQRRIAKELDVAIPTVRHHLSRERYGVLRCDIDGNEIWFKSLKMMARWVDVDSERIVRSIVRDEWDNGYGYYWCDMNGRLIERTDDWWVKRVKRHRKNIGTDIDGE